MDTFSTNHLTFNLLDKSCLIILRQKSSGSGRSIHGNSFVFEPIDSGYFDTIGHYTFGKVTQSVPCNAYVFELIPTTLEINFFQHPGQTELKLISENNKI